MRPVLSKIRTTIFTQIFPLVNLHIVLLSDGIVKILGFRDMLIRATTLGDGFYPSAQHAGDKEEILDP